MEIKLWNGLDAHLEATVGVSLATFQALAAIRSTAGSARVQDISVKMSITVGATSKLVDRLERDGLAVRSANPTDRRSSIVALTQTGATTVAAAEAAAESHLAGMLGDILPGQEATRLLVQLTALQDYDIITTNRS
ncbi:MarR family transcriptional regulator [Cryobacterium sp. SO2]|uniref:MarR family winged helix-turn-helix transcriptional regulator n=1 Tax=Cryobacterium sp. SO2 TaxID=1897060 RepID=UPI00223E828E|nr:MarR family transcriptional regulator [Cryobacterium sp. SO2]WEO75966.1 MarR family transcriptional regulator [Cryobacterium sp. SO2]